MLWDAGVLNTHTPLGLQNAVFYAIGKTFCLRGGQEHRTLKLSQLQRDSDKYVYHENVSKNRNGSFKQLHIKSKVVPVYPCPEAGEWCPVYLLDLYISKLPEEAKIKDILYVRPLQKKPSDPSKPWYTSIPIGKHTLHTKSMCAQAGICGHKTNHSLRATGATELYKRGAPEKLIQERTGHRSLEGLRTYERSDDDQHKAASLLLAAPNPIHYDQCLSTTKNCMVNTYTAGPSTSKGFGSGISTRHPVLFNNLQGCTINIMSAPPLPPHVPPVDHDLTETEVDELYSQY